MEEIKNIVLAKLPTDERGYMKYSAEMVNRFMNFLNKNMPVGYKLVPTLNCDYYILNEDGETKISQLTECSFEKLVELFENNQIKD